jgi:hypothetical protein
VRDAGRLPDRNERKVDSNPFIGGAARVDFRGGPNLAITVDASDAAGLVIGHGNATTQLDAPAAEVMLDTTDFVVNTEYPGAQFPTGDFQAAGFQLAALADGAPRQR